MFDKKVKKKLDKIPDVDKNGDPIYKIADIGGGDSKKKEKASSKSGK